MTDAGLLPVGAHCSLSSCNLNDFLPIRCRCNRLFCRDHIAPDIHDCPLQQTDQKDPDAPSTVKLQRCAADSCNKPSLESFIAAPADTTNRSPAICPGCKQAFCAQHREPSTHACSSSPRDPSASAPAEKNAAAKALLAKHFGSATPPVTGKSRTPQSGSPKAKAAQQQIAMMKIRHKAQAGDPRDAAASVSKDERLHLRVSLAGATGSERVFWFRKTVGTGRALDMLANHFKTPITDSQPLKLLTADGDAAGSPLRNDQLLADQTTDGASLMLSR